MTKMPEKSRYRSTPLINLLRVQNLTNQVLFKSRGSCNSSFCLLGSPEDFTSDRGASIICRNNANLEGDFEGDFAGTFEISCTPFRRPARCGFVSSICCTSLGSKLKMVRMSLLSFVTVCVSVFESPAR